MIRMQPTSKISLLIDTSTVADKKWYEPVQDCVEQSCIAYGENHTLRHSASGEALGSSIALAASWVAADSVHRAIIAPIANQLAQVSENQRSSRHALKSRQALCFKESGLISLKSKSGDGSTLNLASPMLPLDFPIKDVSLCKSLSHSTECPLVL